MGAPPRNPLAMKQTAWFVLLVCMCAAVLASTAAASSSPDDPPGAWIDLPIPTADQLQELARALNLPPGKTLTPQDLSNSARAYFHLPAIIPPLFQVNDVISEGLSKRDFLTLIVVVSARNRCQY